MFQESVHQIRKPYWYPNSLLLTANIRTFVPSLSFSSLFATAFY